MNLGRIVYYSILLVIFGLSIYAIVIGSEFTKENVEDVNLNEAWKKPAILGTGISGVLFIILLFIVGTVYMNKDECKMVAECDPHFYD